MHRPVIESSEAINAFTFQMDPIEKTLYRYRAIIETLDTRLRETIGLAADVARCQIETLQEYDRVPPQERRVEWFQSSLQEKLSHMREDYTQNYHSLLNAREGFMENGQLVLLTEEKKRDLEDSFARRLDEKLAEYQSNFVLGETPPDVLKGQLEETLAHRREVYDTLFEEKTNFAMEEQERPEHAEYNALIRQREALRQELHVQDLFSACQLGDTSYVKTHIRSLWFFEKRKLNDQDSRGFPALHYAVYHGRLETVRLLLKEGADPTAPDKDGYHPLHRAAQNGQTIILEELLNKRAPITARGEYGRTPLHMSVFNGKIAATRLLIERGAPINAQAGPEDHCTTPLHDAVQKGHQQMVAMLVRYPDLNVLIKNRAGFSPLDIALLEGKVEIARLLFEHPSFQGKLFTAPPPEKLYRDRERVEALLREFGF
jgi:hypothetical protein